MWIIRWIVLLLLMLLIIGFAMLNTDQKASVSFYWWQTIDLPLWVIMYLSFGVGMIVWFIVSLFQVLSHKHDIRKLKKENRQLKDELDRMRNVTIDETSLPEPNQNETRFNSFEE